MNPTVQPDAKKDPKAANLAPGPNDPKLFNTIIIWDVYCVARSPEEARETAKRWITQEDLKASEEVALSVTREAEVREVWRNEKPLVGNNITDDEFEQRVKGKTTIQIFEDLYTKK